METSPIALCGKIIIDALGVVSKIGKQHGIRIEMPDPRLRFEEETPPYKTSERRHIVANLAR